MTAKFNDNWYSDSQLKELGNIVSQIPDKEGAVIEIGCWEGKSTHFLANKIYPQNLICNDTWLGNAAESHATSKRHISEIILETRDVYSIFLNNMNELTKGNYSIVKEDCLDWLRSFNKPIKFCHIDASHDYESVFKTINLLLPHMIPNGILCGDDFLHASANRKDLNGGVERAVREALPQYQSKKNIWWWINK